MMCLSLSIEQPHRLLVKATNRGDYNCKISSPHIDMSWEYSAITAANGGRSLHCNLNNHNTDQNNKNPFWVDSINNEMQTCAAFMAQASTNSVLENDWILDSGASSHMTPYY